MKAEVAIRATRFLKEIHKEFYSDGLLSIGFNWSQGFDRDGLPVIERTELKVEGAGHGSK